MSTAEQNNPPVVIWVSASSQQPYARINHVTKATWPRAINLPRRPELNPNSSLGSSSHSSCPTKQCSIKTVELLFKGNGRLDTAGAPTMRGSPGKKLSIRIGKRVCTDGAPSSLPWQAQDLAVHTWVFRNGVTGLLQHLNTLTKPHICPCGSTNAISAVARWTLDQFAPPFSLSNATADMLPVLHETTNQFRNLPPALAPDCLPTIFAH